jgi:hypothetical protein
LFLRDCKSNFYKLQSPSRLTSHHFSISLSDTRVPVTRITPGRRGGELRLRVLVNGPYKAQPTDSPLLSSPLRQRRRKSLLLQTLADSDPASSHRRRHAVHSRPLLWRQHPRPCKYLFSQMILSWLLPDRI